MAPDETDPGAPGVPTLTAPITTPGSDGSNAGGVSGLSGAAPIAAGAGVGLLGTGGLAAAGLRGLGSLPTPAAYPTAAGAVRPIGATARAVGTGALGRSVAAPGSPATRPSRGGAAGAGSRRGRDRREGRERDATLPERDDPDQWLDDEPHGPAALQQKTRGTEPPAAQEPTPVTIAPPAPRLRMAPNEQESDG